MNGEIFVVTNDPFRGVEANIKARNIRVEPQSMNTSPGYDARGTKRGTLSHEAEF